MAGTGDKTFSSRDRGAAPRRSFEALPVGDYEFSIKASNWEIRKAEGEGKLPYLNGPLELLNTAREGGKNRTVYSRLWTSITPKDGSEFAAVDGQDQTIALARALGEELEGVSVLRNVRQTYEDRATGKTVSRTTDILDPKSLEAWLKSHDGMTGKLHLKRRKRQDGNGFENEVDYFIAGEAAETEEVAEEYEAEAEVEAEAEEVEEEVEEAPAKRPVQPGQKKPAAKVVRRR